MVVRLTLLVRQKCAHVLSIGNLIVLLWVCSYSFSIEHWFRLRPWAAIKSGLCSSYSGLPRCKDKLGRICIEPSHCWSLESCGMQISWLQVENIQASFYASVDQRGLSLAHSIVLSIDYINYEALRILRFYIFRLQCDSFKTDPDLYYATFAFKAPAVFLRGFERLKRSPKLLQRDFNFFKWTKSKINVH